jgi:hypothetical protein
LFAIADGPAGLAAALDRLCAEASAAIEEGCNILILSDRGVDAKRAPVPALLALGAVQQHLVATGTRMEAGLLVETGEAREVHDLAVLIGYGAAAVNPYLALDAVAELVARGDVKGPADAAIARYLHACDDGLLKIMSKMASRRCSRTAGRRSSRRSGSSARWSIATSPARPRASKAWASRSSGSRCAIGTTAASARWRRTS